MKNRSEYLRNYYKENKRKLNDKRLDNYYHSRYGISSDQIEEFKKTKPLKLALQHCSAELIDIVCQNLAPDSVVRQQLQRQSFAH